jgi:glycogen synthase
MKMLMFGWEFPPLSNGGLGTACYGLTKALSGMGVEITLVLPKAADGAPDFVKIIPTNMSSVSITKVNSMLKGYMTSEEYERQLKHFKEKGIMHMYGQDLFEEIERYSKKAAIIAKAEPHDVIYAHDWMTFKAAMAAKAVSHKPMVVQIHSTEFDRTGGHGVNQHVYDIERQGMKSADAVIAVSHFTKKKILNHYDVAAEKIHVVHNAVEPADIKYKRHHHDKKVVLYLGRITLQKGPEYFIHAAKKVLEHCPNTTFVMAGTGDMERRMIELAAQSGISDKVLFSGFLKDEKVHEAYRMADLYVMPSVSEPFGITALEAMMNNTPIVISKQSGVSEIVSHCLKVDFWDINKMADMMISVLQHPELHHTLQDNGASEVSKIRWENSAKRCLEVCAQVGVNNG